MKDEVLIQFTRTSSQGQQVETRHVKKSLWDEISKMKNKPGLWKYAKEIKEDPETISLGINKKKPGPKPKVQDEPDQEEATQE